MRKPVQTAIFLLMFTPSKVSALQLRETHCSFSHQKRKSCLAFGSPPQRRLAYPKFINRQNEKRSTMILNYRNTSYDDDYMAQELHTDKLWQSALVADSLRLELKPVRDTFTRTYKESSDEFFETAKAFIPVVIEIGVVAAVASTVPLS